MYRYLLFLILTPSIFSCISEGDRKEQELKKEMMHVEQEVMQIHDEAMARLEDVNNMSKKLEQRLSIENDQADSLALARGLEQLTDADSMMWEWMYNFKKPDSTSNYVESMTYLQSEREKIILVKDLMFSSLALADSLLENSNKQ